MTATPITLADLLEKYNGEDKCRAYLEELRWPNGPTCPKCGGKDVMRVGGRESVLRCKPCDHQFTVTVGTIFHDSHLPLAKWFVAVCLLCEAKKGMSALQLKRLLGTGYKTAWYLTHRIRQAMMNANGADEKLTGTVEIDETWVGGKNHEGGDWRDGKTCVVGITERGGKLRLMVVEDLTSTSIRKAVKKWVSKDLQLIVSDSFSSYVPAIGPIYRRKYTRVNNSQPYLEGQQNTNCIENRFSLLKRGIVGSWHKVSVKHLQRYLEEISFRFSQRKNPALFSQTLLSLLTTNPLTFDQLTKGKAA